MYAAGSWIPAVTCIDVTSGWKMEDREVTVISLIVKAVSSLAIVIPEFQLCPHVIPR